MARGFTLLELLVVAALVTIISATTVIALRSLGHDPLQREAERLLLVWDSLCAESAADARPLGLSLAAGAYQGVQPGRGKIWRGTPGPLYAVHDLPDDMRLELPGTDSGTQPGDSLAEVPQLLCLPGGSSQGPAVRLRSRGGATLVLDADPQTGQRQIIRPPGTLP